MYDLVAIGDITIDLFFRGKSLTTVDNRFSLAVGGKYLADSFYHGVGGGAANVAIDASAHDLDVAVCGLVGENSLKQLIIQHLVKENVSTELLLFERDFMNISAILLSENGEKTVIHYPSPEALFVIPDQIERQLFQGKAYFFGHIPQATLTKKISIIDNLSKTNSPIFLNLGTTDLLLKIGDLRPLLDKTNALILNAYEYAQLVNKNKADINFEHDLGKEIDLYEKLLVVTDGAFGSYAYNKGQIYYQKAAKVEKVIDATGVGDAYTAAFIASFIKDGNIQSSMEKASKFAAKKLTRLGAN